MQKGIRKHAWLYVIVAVLIAVVLVSLYYQFGYLPQKQSGTSSQGTVGSVGGQMERLHRQLVVQLEVLCPNLRDIVFFECDRFRDDCPSYFGND